MTQQERIEQAAEEYFNQRNCPFGLKDLETFHYAANYALSHQWISVDDELPKEEGRCLCHYQTKEGCCVDFGLWQGDKWYMDGVTHWMEIPTLEGGEE